MKVKKNSLICVSFFLILWVYSIASKILPQSMASKIIFINNWGGVLATLLMVLYASKVHNERRPVAKNYAQLLFKIQLLILIAAPIHYFYSSITRAYGFSYITRWSSEYIRRICMIMAIFCLFTICGKKSIELISNTAIALCGILFVAAILRYGLFQVLLGIIYSDSAAHAMMETNDLSFSIGIFVLYLLFFDTETKKRKQKIVLGLFFFVLAGKRIGIAALVFAILLGLIFRNRCISKKMIIYIGTFGIVATMIFLGLLYNSDFMNALEVHGVSTSGRAVVYAYFTRRSSFGIDFLGWGQAATSKIIENMDASEVGNMVVLRGLHSDILKRYLDGGFIGYLVWSIFNLIYVPLKILKRFGEKSARVYMVVICYAFVVYLTDNMDSSFSVQVMLYLMPLIYYSQNIMENIQMFIPKVRYWIGRRGVKA